MTVTYGIAAILPICLATAALLLPVVSRTCTSLTVIMLMMQAFQDNECWLNIDCSNLYDFDSMLYSHLVKYPSEVLSLVDVEIDHLVTEVAADGHSHAGILRVWASTSCITETQTQHFSDAVVLVCQHAA